MSTLTPTKPTVLAEMKPAQDQQGTGVPGSWMSWRILVLVGLMVAFYPTGRWFMARMTDGSDEPWGILALLGALVWVPWKGVTRPLKTREMVLLILLVGSYAILPGELPPMLGGFIAVLAAAVLLYGAGAPPAVMGLLILSLPLVASLQFYFGYPLRVLTATLSADLLQILGYEVTRQGTLLEWAGERVAVDAPCSGIRMLWSGGFLAAFLAAWFRLSWLASGVAAFATLGIVLLGNVLRATGLFFTELRLIWVAPWAHEFWGFLCFAFVAGTLAGTILRLRSFGLGLWSRSPATRGEKPPRFLGILLGIAMVAAAESWITRETVPSSAQTDSEIEPIWPQSFDGLPLRRLPLSDQDTAFAKSFPGQIASFTDGHRRFLFRRMSRPTRRLHSPEDCLRAMGYAVVPLSLFQDAHGSWGCVLARAEGRSLEFRHQIKDSKGMVFTDVSAWYWACLLGRSRGPWQAVTIWQPRVRE